MAAAEQTHPAPGRLTRLRRRLGDLHPIARLIDGPPDASGPAVARRVTLLLVPTVAQANAIGAGVVLILAAFVVPTPEDTDDAGLLLNGIAGAAYLLVALVIGVAWGRRRMRPLLGWLRDERDPTPGERRRALRAPLVVLVPNVVLWGLAAIGIVALNLTVGEPLVALTAGITTLLGGVTTCGYAYVLGERVLRPVATRALRAGSPERPQLPGIMARSLTAWMLGSGVAALGTMAVGLAALVGAPVDTTDLAITMLGLGAVVLVFGPLLTWLATRLISAPVVSVRRALQRVQEGDLEVGVPVYDGSELGLLQAGVNEMVGGLRERARIRDLFGRHVGEEVAHRALERDVELGGELREVSVVFVDVIGSTALAERGEPAEVVSLLNEFFAVVVEEVERAGGWVNKFEGDAALAIFGAPVPRDDAADGALRASRVIATRLRDEIEGLAAAVGASTGTVVAGNVGAERRFEYTVIGDPVNEAARLCELAKEHEGRALASDALIAAAAGEAERWREHAEITLRGRSSPTGTAVPT